MAKIIDGKTTAASLREELKMQVHRDVSSGMRSPVLAVVLVGNDPASVSYVTGKHKACDEVGIISRDMHLEASTDEAELLRLVDELNRDAGVDGILVQLPLPPHINEDRVVLSIAPEKDVDGFHPVSLGKLMIGMAGFLPCTPNGIVELMVRNSITLEGKHVCIVGRSNIVGKPLANLLLAKSPRGNATVTVCHSRSGDLSRYTREADILIAAVGKPQVITAEMIKPGAVVIDVGVNRVDDSSKKRGYRLVGDVDFEGACAVASMITPVPGGVGPMTIAMLMHNTVTSWKRCR